MADYFTKFSCILALGSAVYAERALEIYHDLGLEYGQDGLDVGFLASIDDDEPDTLWIQDGGAGDTEHVIDFVRRCGKVLKLQGRWGFEWANTCNRPHLTAFGGGAFVLDLATGDELASVFTNLWLVKTLEAGGDHA